MKLIICFLMVLTAASCGTAHEVEKEYLEELSTIGIDGEYDYMVESVWPIIQRRCGESEESVKSHLSQIKDKSESYQKAVKAGYNLACPEQIKN